MLQIIVPLASIITVGLVYILTTPSKKTIAKRWEEWNISIEETRDFLRSSGRVLAHDVCPIIGWRKL